MNSEIVGYSRQNIAALVVDNVGPFDILVRGKDVAELWWNLDSEQQAEFFNVLSSKRNLVCQLQEVTDSEKITPLGRACMDDIGSYAYKENK